MAASDASKEAIYLSRFVAELGLPDPSPLSIHVDNQGAIDLAYNPEHHQRTKHIERRHFFIREAVERGEIRVPFVKTDANIADFFTKPLSSKRFFTLRDKIMNVPSRSSQVAQPRDDSATLTAQLYDASDKYAAASIISEHYDT